MCLLEEIELQVSPAWIVYLFSHLISAILITFDDAVVVEAGVVTIIGTVVVDAIVGEAVVGAKVERIIVGIGVWVVGARVGTVMPALSKQMYWPTWRAVQSKPGLYERIEAKAILVFNEMVSQVSPAATVYLFMHWTFGYGVNPCLATHNCWPYWRPEHEIG